MTQTTIAVDPERLARVTKLYPEWEPAFWDQVSFLGDCWLWQGARNEDGYGGFCRDGHIFRSHRMAWWLVSGKPPKGLHVLHKCDNPPCCRPDHLFVGTNHDNVLDRHRKGRSKNLFSPENHPATERRGERHWCAKLNADQVREIRTRRATGEKVVSLGIQFGAHHSTISRIARGIWREEVV